MFGFFKKNKKNDDDLKLIAPATGKVMPLSTVPDPVFAEKLAGDGVAIELTDDLIVAPADGEITILFKTKHAFAMTLENGLEVLVHIGIETVSLNGEGFTQLAEQGTKVKAGTPILKVDREFIKSKGLPLISPILITNMDSISTINTFENINAVAGETTVLDYKLN